MVNVREDELFKLIEQGIKGNANAFTLLCRKMINNIRKNDEALASKLASLVAEGTVLRGASSKAPMPVDGDSRRNLCRKHLSTQLLKNLYGIRISQRSWSQLLTKERMLFLCSKLVLNL